MAGFERPLAARLEQLAADRQVMLRRNGVRPFPMNDSHSIVSPVPDVHVETGQGDFKGRPRRLILEGKERNMVLLARTRPVPQRRGGPLEVVAWATDRHGGRVPVCGLDRRRCDLHWLIDLESAFLVDRGGDGDPVRQLADLLFAGPVDELLRDQPDPKVGRHVADQVGELQARRRGFDRTILQEELSLLQRLSEPGSFRRAVARRVDTLRGMLDALPPAGERTRARVRSCREEASRLQRLVASRACSALRLRAGRITGLLNPKRIDRRLILSPLLFRLCLGRRRGYALEFWHPEVPEPARRNGVCLGEGGLVLGRQHVEGDLFSMVDSVINFSETNLIGAPPWVQRRRGLAGFFQDLF